MSGSRSLMADPWSPVGARWGLHGYIRWGGGLSAVVVRQFYQWETFDSEVSELEKELNHLK